MRRPLQPHESSSWTQGTRHHLVGLVVRAFIWFAALLPLGIAAAMLASKQETHKQYFAACAVFCFLAMFAWLLEAVCLLPVVFNLCPASRKVASAHNKQVVVEVTSHRTTIAIPAVVRHCVVRAAQLAALPFIAAGAAVISMAPDTQLLVELLLGIALLVFIGLLLSVVLPAFFLFVQRCSRQAGTGSLKVLQYNINGCVGSDGVFDVMRVANAIKASGADIVAIQSVGRNCRVTPDGIPCNAAREGVDQVRAAASCVCCLRLPCAVAASLCVPPRVRPVAPPVR
jgi:hypothetical protein